MARQRPPHLKPRASRVGVHPEEIELFRRSVADATPLPRTRNAKVEKPRPKPRVRSGEVRVTGADDLSDRAFDIGEHSEALSFSRSGVRRDTLRALRRGGTAIEDELDLHGLTVAAAKPLLVAFLNSCARSGCTRVRVIHGKGLRSPGGEGILKRMVAGWLSQREDVLAFCEAPPAQGGAGAMLVLLKRR